MYPISVLNCFRIMNETNTSSSRVSYSQLEALLAFMEEHRELAAGFLRSTEARHKSQKLWEELGITLNCIGGGSIKTAKGWSKYWSDYKNKLKARVRSLNKSHTGTGGGGALGPPLSAIEERAVGIMGPQFGKNIKNVQVDPLPPLNLNEGCCVVLPFGDENCPPPPPPPPATTATVTSGGNTATTSHSGLYEKPEPNISYATDNDEHGSSTPIKRIKMKRQRISTPRSALAEAKADVLNLQQEQLRCERATASALTMIAEAMNRQAAVNERQCRLLEEGLLIWKKANERSNEDT
ncbi:uncharacterized protein LOC125488850 isoform X1 [Plutella xylostella]|nr:uncharacterized protein LOC105383566 isoform X1 [Plutella xylostella]XP_048478428.1 uncharacterized protein LOC125488850 isoform X1 [Plutella xylostella]